MCISCRVTEPNLLPKEQKHQSAQKSGVSQRTPWGGGKKRRVQNLMNDAPPKKGFWTPPSYGAFSTPLRRQCSVFLYITSRQSRPEASGGVQKVSGERVLGALSSPHTFCTLPYHGLSFCRFQKDCPKVCKAHFLRTCFTTACLYALFGALPGMVNVLVVRAGQLEIHKTRLTQNLHKRLSFRMSCGILLAS